jgi:hypothetical protein
MKAARRFRIMPGFKVYLGDRLICQCYRRIDAQMIVVATNLVSDAVREVLRDPPRLRRLNSRAAQGKAKERKH